MSGDQKPISRKPWGFIALGSAALLFGALYFAYWVTDPFQGLRHAYMAFSANARAANAMEEYVQERMRWPTSWKDFESISATMSPDSLPSGGWDEIRTYVVINFDLSLSDVAKQQLDSFDAIKPIPPVREGYRSEYQSLLETIRSVSDSIRESEP